MLLVTWGSTVDTDMETDSCMSHDTDGTLPTWILDMNRDTHGNTLSHGDFALAEGMVTLVANISIDNLTLLPTWMVNIDGDRDCDTGRRQGWQTPCLSAIFYAELKN